MLKRSHPWRFCLVQCDQQVPFKLLKVGMDLPKSTPGSSSVPLTRPRSPRTPFVACPSASRSGWSSQLRGGTRTLRRRRRAQCQCLQLGDSGGSSGFRICGTDPWLPGFWFLEVSCDVFLIFLFHPICNIGSTWFDDLHYCSWSIFALLDTFGAFTWSSTFLFSLSDRSNNPFVI